MSANALTLDPLGGQDRQTFLGRVAGLRRWLADNCAPTDAVALLCDRRSTFLCGLAAALADGRAVLLPNDATLHTLEVLRQTTGPLIVLDDALIAAAPDAPPQPFLPADGPLIHLFTSGTTGVPVDHHRSWASFVQASAAWITALALPGDTAALVATVPPQHMYGFEASIVLPLAHPGIAVYDSRPFYPADVAAALRAVAAPRVLITTPVHLDVLVRATADLPPLHAIVSATAPLSLELATQAEALWGAPVIDLYGSTETGMIATRRQTTGEAWTLRDDITLTIAADGTTLAAGAHLAAPVRLADHIEGLPDGRIRLLGRDEDMLNIVGKRASLAGLTRHLLALPGIEDGMFVVPERANARPVAIVVAPTLDAETIRRHLRSRVAEAFVPRRVVFVDHLPRTTVGKVRRAAVLALIDDRTP